MYDGEFNDDLVCHGGLFFCLREDMWGWLRLHSEMVETVWDVELPSDAYVIDMGTKLKLNQSMYTRS